MVLKYKLKPLFLERMQKLLPNKKDFQKYMKILEKEPVKSIRCNTIKISPSELKSRLKNKGWKIKQPFKNYPEIIIVEGKFVESVASDNNKLVNTINPKNSDVLTNKKISERQRSKLGVVVEDVMDLEPGELGRSLEHQLGYYYVQEITSMMPIITLNPKPNDVVLDLCAAPGSKTTQAAAKMQNQGTLIANEVSFGRIKILASNLQRCGTTNTIITKKDGIALCKKLAKGNVHFDKILIDTPCSGEGTLRSNPKTAIMWNIKSIKNLSRLQKALVASAIPLLKPKGELVYSTCTHAPEENEKVVDFMLKNFDNIKIEKIELPIKCRCGVAEWEGGAFNKEVKKSCRIYPQDNNTEGFFIAKFKKIKQS